MSLNKVVSVLIRAPRPLNTDLRRLVSLASIAGLGILVLASLACTLPTIYARDAAAGSLPQSVTASPIGDKYELPVTQIRAQPVTITPLPSPTALVQQVCTVSTGVKDGTVNIRSGPGMEYPVIGWTWEGAELTMIGDPVDGWQKLSSDGWLYIARWCR